MAEEIKEEQAKESMTMYYVIGAIVVAVIAVGAFMLRPKSTTEPTPAGTSQEVGETPKTTPITTLECESQYYNPVVGFEQYYLSAAGVATNETESVECNFTMSRDGSVVATDSADAIMEPNEARGGQTFRCTTKALDLAKSVPTIVDVEITDDLGSTHTCSRTFQLP